MADAVLWRREAGSADDLVVRVLDGETLVFDDLTGDTHLLTEQAAGLLAALHDRPCSLAELCQALGGETVADPAAVRSTLLAMAALRLVEGVPA